MNIIIKKKVKLLLYVLLVIGYIVIVTFKDVNLVWKSSVNKYINKIYKQQMLIRDDRKFSYKGKAYRIIFSTPENEKNKLYLQCFEEKLNGLAYKPTYGSLQGDSKALYGMTKNFLNNGGEDSFLVVYGYNKNLMAGSFSVKKLNSNQWITQNISQQEYFSYIYTDIEYPVVEFKDKRNKDISSYFYGG